MDSACTDIDRSREAVVLINPAAGGGTALRKWRRIREEVRHRLEEMTVVMVRSEEDVSDLVRAFLGSGHRRFVAAGGDGTVRAVAESLVAGELDGESAHLGAIALGSSNDYHKPVVPHQQIAGISCKIDFGQVQPRDVGVLRYEVEPGLWAERSWIINASLGITASANDFFNSPNALLRLFKRRWTAVGILYAALRSIVRHRSANRWVQVASGPSKRTRVTNLGVVKNPHFSGSFSYDSSFDPTSGRFHVHLCEDMSLAETLWVLWHLSHGRFTGVPHTATWTTDRLFVTAAAPFPVEFDGEVIRTQKASFSIAPNRLEVCV